MNPLQQILHGQTCLMIGKSFEPIENFASNNFLAGLRYEPMVQEDGRSRISESTDADVGFPKSCLEIPPVFLVSIFYVRIGFQETLKDEILDLRNRKSDLLANLRNLERERNQFKAERDELNKVASESFANVRELKDKRDKNNRSIQELKAVRRDVLEEMKGLIEKAKSLQEEIQSLDISEKVQFHAVPKRRRTFAFHG